MLTVIGCGNLSRGDDGVGVVVARRLNARLARHPVPGVQVFDCGTSGVDVMFKARGTDGLLILDAARSGSPPGTIYDVPGEDLARDWTPSFSLHDFRWDHALAAGRRIFKDAFPTDVRVWLVEAETVEYGLNLSRPVQEAAEVLYRRALQAVADHAAQRHGAMGVQDCGVSEEPTDVLRLERGSIRLSREVYDRYFDGREGVLLLEKGLELCLVPVESVAGGVLVKQRTKRGDRVIHAQEFFGQRGVDPFLEMDVPFRWNPDVGGLAFRIPGPADGTAGFKEET